MNEFEYLKFEIKDDIAILTLCRPEKFNVFSEPVFKEMLECQRIVKESENVRAVLIRAEGKHFSSGMDLNFLVGKTPRMVHIGLQKYQQAYYGWEQLAVPVIAAIQGKCMGNATEFLLSLDLRIAARGAQFSFLEVKYAGIAPDMGGTSKLCKLVGIGSAKRLILTGEEIDADEAKRIGLVEYVVDDDKLDEEAFKLCKGITKQAPLGMMAAKMGINLAAESSTMAASYYERMQAMYCVSSEDMQEALTATLQKRKPVYKGQ